VTALLAFAVGGCYTYRPVESPVAGSVVRVGVPVMSAVQNPNAPLRTESFEGAIVSNDGVLVLAIETRRPFGGFREIVGYDTLRLTRDQIASVEAREFSKNKSVGLGLVIGAGVAGLAAVAFGTFGGSGPGSTVRPPPPQPSIVIDQSVLSVLWGLVSR
jgi:hypothetical protein